MNISKGEIRKIVDGLLPDLVETEKRKSKRMVEGRQLIYRGTKQDVSGNAIMPGTTYEIDEIRLVKVDHRVNLSKLIKAAADESEMEEIVGLYLVKYGKKYNQ